MREFEAEAERLKNEIDAILNEARQRFEGHSAAAPVREELAGRPKPPREGGVDVIAFDSRGSPSSRLHDPQCQNIEAERQGPACGRADEGGQLPSRRGGQRRGEKRRMNSGVASVMVLWRSRCLAR